jgi:hypothetical protein
MTEEHPIATLSESLVLQWSDEWYKAKVKHMTREKYMCMQAAQWGANKELEACCEWLFENGYKGTPMSLRAARRPKPPSLKEQALQALDRMDQLPTAEDQHIIRHALEQLND